MASVASLDVAFAEFHATNPEVYRELVALALDAARTVRGAKRGRQRIGIKMLWEVVRWNRFLVTRHPGVYKLNNNLHSRYARLIMAQEPDLDGLFEVRGK